MDLTTASGDDVLVMVELRKRIAYAQYGSWRLVSSTQPSTSYNFTP